MMKRLVAEFLGTFWLVLGGCGAAVLAAHVVGADGYQFGIGYMGVALAFGLTVLTGVYAFGHISGAHFNPAVTLGLWAGDRFPHKDVVPYIVAQVVGAIAAGWILFQIASGQAGFAIDPNAAGAFASNGYGALSPQGYSVAAAFLCEVVMTAFFLIVIMGATHGSAPAGFAGIAIGLALTLLHLISIPVTNTSVNPARSNAAVAVAGIVDGARSPQGYAVAAAVLCEVVIAAFFLIVIMGATHGRAPAGFAGIAIGLALTLIHLISIPVTNTSVNPARSTGVALFAGAGAISQLWLFWVAPFLGGLPGGIAYRWLGQHRPDVVGDA